MVRSIRAYSQCNKDSISQSLTLYLQDMFQMIAKRMPKKAKKTRANIVPVSGGDADAVAKDEAKSCCVLQ